MRLRWRSRRAVLEREIVAAGKELAARDLVVSSTGNVSARWGTGFVITPSRFPYRYLRRRHLVAVDAHGRSPTSIAPSRGTALHAAIYRNRPEVDAIVHHHGPHATAWSLLDSELAPRLEDAAYFGTGPVGVVTSASYDSPAFTDECVDRLGSRKAVLLAGHGLIALGDDIAEAMAIAVAIEHEARVAWMVRHQDAAGRA